MNSPSVKIWVKKQVRLDLLTFRQQEMVQIGAAGLLSVKKRLALGQGPNDTPAKPLSKRYAAFKKLRGKGTKRDLWYTGKMLSNLQLRTVSDNSAKARLTSALYRDNVGPRLTQIEPWLVFSPANRRAAITKIAQLFEEKIKSMVKTGGPVGK